MAEIRDTVFGFVKTDNNGEITNPVSFGARGDKVYYSGTNYPPYTVNQLFEAFLQFLAENHYIFKGTTEPTNPNTKIWIDENEDSDASNWIVRDETEENPPVEENPEEPEENNEEEINIPQTNE